jgi:hypothetical protein
MVMNELMMLGLGGFGSGIDIAALIAFLAFAAVYFLAPVVGYEPYRPAGLTMALYAMIVYAGISLIQLVVQWLLMLDGPRPVFGGGGGFGRNEFGIHIMLLFGFIKVLLFLIAMIAFVAGLRNLRLRHYGPED